MCSAPQKYGKINTLNPSIFFPSPYSIELASRQLACGHRSLIYAHLADHLPCGKETLIKRAKKLRENQQDDQLKVPIQRLKDGKIFFVKS